MSAGHAVQSAAIKYEHVRGSIDSLVLVYRMQSGDYTFAPDAILQLHFFPALAGAFADNKLYVDAFLDDIFPIIYNLIQQSFTGTLS